MNRTIRYLLFTIMAFASFSFSQAQFSLSPLFSDHAILQQELRTPIWGVANPGAYVEVKMGELTIYPVADAEGKWMDYLPPQPAGGPHTIEISAQGEVVASRDIWFGEVWLCGGQSNMEYTLGMLDKTQAISQAKDSLLRFFQVPRCISPTPIDSLQKGKWESASPSSARDFSAVGYFYGKKLREELDVPIGLISSNWGGTVIETWLSPDAASKIPYYSTALDSLTRLDIHSGRAIILKYYRKLMAKMGNPFESGIQEDLPVWAGETYDDKKWGLIPIPGLWESQGLPNLNGKVWFRHTFKMRKVDPEATYILSLGKIDDSDLTWINGKLVGSMTQKWNEERMYEVPGSVLKKGNNVLAIRVDDTGGGGGLWSEADKLYLKGKDLQLPLAGKWKYRISSQDLSPTSAADDPNALPTLLYNGMIHPLVPYAMRGVIWYQGESNANRGEEYQTLFPALITDWRAKWQQELSFYFVQLANYGSEAKALGDSPWAELREAQTKTLHLPKTGMAIAIDIGEGDDIHPKNKEDVGLRLAYHALAKDYGMDVAYEGPRFREMKVYDNKIFVGFDHAASGLLMGKGKEKLIGFLIAGEDRIFHPAEAYIQGKFVVVSSPKVTQPVAVRYAWAENPGDVNLYNRKGLPAVPFRSDNWPLTSAGKRKVYVKE